MARQIRTDDATATIIATNVGSVMLTILVLLVTGLPEIEDPMVTGAVFSMVATAAYIIGLGLFEMEAEW